MHVRARALAEVGSLGVPPPDEAVAVLNGAFLPGGVGAGVVDVASDDGLYLPGVEELAAVVGYQKFLITDIIGNQALSGIPDEA